MRKAKLLTGLCLAVLMFGFTSCKKEGCTDGDATNFDSEAKDDDGSCKFESEVVTWWGVDVSQAAQINDVTTINIYLDGSLVKSSESTKYWTGAPECNQSGSYTKKFDLGNSKSKSISYRGEAVFDDGSKEDVWKGNLTINANTCHKLNFPLQ